MSAPEAKPSWHSSGLILDCGSMRSGAVEHRATSMARFPKFSLFLLAFLASVTTLHAQQQNIARRGPVAETNTFAFSCLR
jgi:hypothetical protein